MAQHKLGYESLVEKALHNPGFYAGLKKDPAQALKAEGLTATPELIAALKAVDYNAIHKVALACSPTKQDIPW